MKALLGLLWFAWTMSLQAAPGLAQLAPELPHATQVAAQIEQEPSVAQARAALQAAEHTAAMIRISPYEWTARLHAQKRRYDGAGTSSEWGAQLERPIRIGGKAAIDTQLAETTIRQAMARLGEARHEASRALLEGWLDWLAAVHARELVAEQLTFVQASEKTVDSRRRAGDASMLDVNVARGDAAEVRRQLGSANAQVDKAAARLRVRFPGLTPEFKSLSLPVEPEGSEVQWLARIADASESLWVAQEDVKRAELVAARASAERVADPTIGVYAASEAFRSERIVGVSISIPLGGNYRRERVNEALQQVEVARAALDAQRRAVELQVAEIYSEAVSAVQRWRQSEETASTARETSRLTQRAYTLGESDLQALLLVRRQTQDALAAANAARIEALRARYRLWLDAEILWTEPDHRGLR